ncbi:hypothetical protein [Kineosporia sp. A_224]|uniref:hypothetical protein n=1 Tax=Kineosporia sp. A_224 TaxID=1962180 RepID=UPI000B4B9CFC|nr:hypothetical protein [Kineosporia sp. A_224]
MDGTDSADGPADEQGRTAEGHMVAAVFAAVTGASMHFSTVSASLQGDGAVRLTLSGGDLASVHDVLAATSRRDMRPFRVRLVPGAADAVAIDWPSRTIAGVVVAVSWLVEDAAAMAAALELPEHAEPEPDR